MNIKDFNNLNDLFFYQAKKQDPKNIFLHWLNPVNKKQFSWSDVELNIQKLAIVLKKIVKEGDRVLLVSENRPEWLIADVSIMLSGAITVPAVATYTEEDYNYLIEDCEPSVVIVSNNKIYKKLEKIIKEKQFIKKIITFDNIPGMNYQDKYLEFKSITLKNLSDSKKIISSNRKRISPACIIYTSGTGGNPKGVILTHGGILNNIEGANQILKSLMDTKPTFLTWLPLSHSYEHTVQFVQIAVGAKVFYAEKIEKLLDNMSEARPTIMTAVPRFYQNLYNKININFKNASGFKSKLINATIILGKKKLLKEKMNILEKTVNFILSILVRKKIKKQFGGRLKAFVSGGGALDKDIGEFLNAIGLPTLQGYGLTEASPVVSCNPINKIRVDTVGPPFSGNLVKIADDG